MGSPGLVPVCQVKAIPKMKVLLDPVVEHIKAVVERLFNCEAGSVSCKNDNEPHLVKYTGDQHRGVCMHTDSADVTLNVALSDPGDFRGGGTYFEALDQVRWHVNLLLARIPLILVRQTVLLNQGEMLIHKGELKHKGVEIDSGVRIILVVSFYES